MPDEKGKLSPEDKEKVQKWLKEKWKASSNCPISGDNNWIIGDYTVTPMNYGARQAMIGGQIAPQVMLICSSCGYTLYFNAMLMGLFPSGEVSNGKK